MESIESIPMGHKLDLAYLFRSGIIGWQSEARQTYANYAQLHHIQQILIAVNSKNHRAKKVPAFSKLFPQHEELAKLGKKPSLAERWLSAAATLGAKNGTDSS